MFEVRKSNVMGRYLVATKPIKPGELIISETSLVIGPPMHSNPVCLGCNQKVGYSVPQHRCPTCRWPLCSPNCKGINNEFRHSKKECEILAENNIIDSVKRSDGDRLKTIHEIIFYLRCLDLKHSQKENWEKLLTMESHNDLRKDIPLHWYRNQFQIVNTIREAWNVKEFSEEEIHTVCGIVKVNCFGVGRQGIKGRGIFVTTSLIAHDCTPNARVMLDSNNYLMTVRAGREIAQDETITISYVDIFMSTLQRRDELKNAKFFWCICQRCSDPTEFGTYCNALWCETCSSSSILSTDPLNQNAPWRCTNCEHTLGADAVTSILHYLREELEAIDNSNAAGQEKFIERYGNILGENHYILSCAKFGMCQTFCTNSTLIGNFSSNELLERKVKYCNDILKAIGSLVPGQTRIKGIIMFELYIAMMIHSAKKVQDKQMTKTDFRKTMQGVISLLEESAEILQWEPAGTPSRKKAEEAQRMLLQLKHTNTV